MPPFLVGRLRRFFLGKLFLRGWLAIGTPSRASAVIATLTTALLFVLGHNEFPYPRRLGIVFLRLFGAPMPLFVASPPGIDLIPLGWFLSRALRFMLMFGIVASDIKEEPAQAATCSLEPVTNLADKVHGIIHFSLHPGYPCGDALLASSCASSGDRPVRDQASQTAQHVPLWTQPS